MELNETVPGTEVTEPEYVLPVDETEAQTVEVMIVDVERPFLETCFMDYTVSEGLLLLIFVVVFLNFFFNLIRR